MGVEHGTLVVNSHRFCLTLVPCLTHRVRSILILKLTMFFKSDEICLELFCLPRRLCLHSRFSRRTATPLPSTSRNPLPIPRRRSSSRPPMDSPHLVTCLGITTHPFSLSIRGTSSSFPPNPHRDTNGPIPNFPWDMVPLSSGSRSSHPIPRSWEVAAPRICRSTPSRRERLNSYALMAGPESRPSRISTSASMWSPS